MSEEKKMSDEKKWSVERNFRRLVIILSSVALVLGMIPAFLIGHWLFFFRVYRRLYRVAMGCLSYGETAGMDA
ncbi:MAG: hypothetical protein M5R38_09235 [Candidatus Methylomirabilis sp.]|nr:hypothetical protein [Candidatus Methylomirabilis sp.]